MKWKSIHLKHLKSNPLLSLLSQISKPAAVKFPSNYWGFLLPQKPCNQQPLSCHFFMPSPKLACLLKFGLCLLYVKCVTLFSFDFTSLCWKYWLKSSTSSTALISSPLLSKALKNLIHCKIICCLQLCWKDHCCIPATIPSSSHQVLHCTMLLLNSSCHKNLITFLIITSTSSFFWRPLRIPTTQDLLQLAWKLIIQ